MKKTIFLSLFALSFVLIFGMLSVSNSNAASLKPLKINSERLLERHNYYRELVGNDPLSWSEDLAGHAQEWADSLALKCEFEHQNGTYGENIFWTTTKNKDEYAVVDFWAKEEKYFNHDKPIFNRYDGEKYRHYSQIIWMNTTLMGGARQRCLNGEEIWVCVYDPKGNIHGQQAHEILVSDSTETK